MNRREFITFFGGAAVAWPRDARAQQQAKPVIGFLDSGLPNSTATSLSAFHRGLQEAGYIEGLNVAIEFRRAENRYERLPALALDLVRHQVSVIYASNVVSALAAKDATSSIPIVFQSGIDPVEIGLVASLSRPGGNLTGISMFAGGLAAKRLGLLHELAPKASLTAVLVNPKNANSAVQVRDLEAAARAIGREIQVFNADSASAFEPVYRRLAEVRAEALVVGADPMFNSNRDRLVALSARHAIPAIYEWREFAAAGGLMSYGTNLSDSVRRAGIYVGRILKGENPSDLPVEQPTNFELVINLRSAKALGLAIPPTLLARADEVIE